MVSPSESGWFVAVSVLPGKKISLPPPQPLSVSETQRPFWLTRRKTQLLFFTAYSTLGFSGSKTRPLTSRPSGPVVVFHAHWLSETTTVELPGQVVGGSAVAGSAPVPEAASGWHCSVGIGLSGLVTGVWQAVALDAPKLFNETETNPPPSRHRANASAP